jgi:NADPH-dependent 2,4-dienoyl-CoA reductase/sulfur reductase-like enzyme
MRAKAKSDRRDMTTSATQQHRPGKCAAELPAAFDGEDVVAGVVIALAVPFGGGCGGDDESSRSIAIVGGGMAGLYCAYVLKNAGVRATVYEASTRTGGRIYSARGPHSAEDRRSFRAGLRARRKGR